MAAELVNVGKGELAATIEKGGVAELIKPLTKDIRLLNTYVAGTTHIRDKALLDAITVGDILKTQREDNRFDRKAILLLNQDGRKVGYIPEKDNTVLAALMDAGKLLKAKVTKVSSAGQFKNIAIEVELVDF